jgi:hypothetical protein
VSSLPKASPLRVGVETELHSLLLSLFAKRLARDIAVQPVMVVRRLSTFVVHVRNRLCTAHGAVAFEPHFVWYVIWPMLLGLGS